MTDDDDAAVFDGGPAFPRPYDGVSADPGMTLRDWFAGQALTGLLGRSYDHMRGTEVGINISVARDAYKLADAMLKAREVRELRDGDRTPAWPRAAGVDGASPSPLGKYRKKPVEIEAWQFTAPLTKTSMPDWLHKAILQDAVSSPGGAPYLTIRTREGEMRADLGDWIIRGVEGGLYPCKLDFFAKTYDEPAADPCRSETRPADAAWESFGREIMLAWPNTGIDGCDLQDIALKHGILREIPGGFDPARHSDVYGVNLAPGDTWFEIVPPDGRTE